MNPGISASRMTRPTGPAGEKVPVDLADLVVPGRDPPGGKGEHRVRLVQGDESLDISGIRPLEEELAEVLWPGRRLSAGVRGHVYHHRFRCLSVRVILAILTPGTDKPGRTASQDPRAWSGSLSALPGQKDPMGGGDGNRTRVQGFAGPCLCHSATPPQERASPAANLPHSRASERTTGFEPATLTLAR